MDWVQQHRAFEKRIDDKADLIRKHIPVVDVSLIVEDYAAEPITWWDPKICIVCSHHNSRSSSIICKNCVRVCLGCKEFTCSSDRKNFCKSCSNLYPDMEFSNTMKGVLYQMWHKSIYPSEVHRDYQARLKQAAAKKLEEKKKQDEFLDNEAKKPLLTLVLELRKKLWEANEAINNYKATHYEPDLAPRPKFPYY